MGVELFDPDHGGAPLIQDFLKTVREVNESSGKRASCVSGQHAGVKDANIGPVRAENRVAGNAQSRIDAANVHV